MDSRLAYLLSGEPTCTGSIRLRFRDFIIKNLQDLSIGFILSFRRVRQRFWLSDAEKSAHEPISARFQIWNRSSQALGRISAGKRNKHPLSLRDDTMGRVPIPSCFSTNKSLVPFKTASINPHYSPLKMTVTIGKSNPSAGEYGGRYPGIAKMIRLTPAPISARRQFAQ